MRARVKAAAYWLAPPMLPTLMPQYAYELYVRGMEAKELWSQVNFDRSPLGCWIFLGKRGPSGHGYVVFRGRRVAAHRLAWESLRGPIPAGKQILHQCDNPPCVNVLEHARLGTHAENMAEMRERGRAHWQRRGVFDPFAHNKLIGAHLQRLADSLGVDFFTFRRWVTNGPAARPVPAAVAEVFREKLGFEYSQWTNGVEGFAHPATMGVGL